MTTTPKRLAGPPQRRPGPAPQHDWDGMAAHLKKYPMVWFEIARDFPRAPNEVTRIKRGQNPAFREGRWDAVSHRELSEDGLSYVKVLSAVYLGPETGEDES